MEDKRLLSLLFFIILLLMSFHQAYNSTFSGPGGSGGMPDGDSNHYILNGDRHVESVRPNLGAYTPGTNLYQPGQWYP